MRLIGISGSCLALETRGLRVVLEQGIPVAVRTIDHECFVTNRLLRRNTVPFIKLNLNGRNSMHVPQSVIEALAEGIEPTVCVRGDENGIKEWSPT